MRFRTGLIFFAMCEVAPLVVGSAFAQTVKLSPQDFNKMYYLAQNGKVGVLREAVNRGLDINAVNPNGDTGLCIAIKRKDHVAYNTFRMAGAHPRHQCTYKIYKEYQEFLDEGKAAKVEQITGNKESLYYKDEERKLWPWLLGGVALGGGIWALTSGGSSGSKSKADSTVIEPQEEYGLMGLVDKYYKLVDKDSVSNTLTLDGANPNGVSVVDNIKLLPNMLDNVDYLQSYIKIINGGFYDNRIGGNILLNDASVGLAAYGNDSVGFNNGTMLIDARNGAIGLAASNGAVVVNNPNQDENSGRIEISFKGGKDGDAVIGMYADTGATALNYGQINGTTTRTTVGQGDSGNFEDTVTGDGDADSERVVSANSGSVVGMGVFDFYTGENNSATTVKAQNYGDINLSAGYNAATDVSVNLVGMGSYIDDKFLNGISNPAFAEQMQLDNYGDISLKYDGTYTVSDTALKFGDGGLIGMRADASTKAVNEGNIDIELTSTQMSNTVDVATGMLSVHGAELINGVPTETYKGTGEAVGVIRVTNEAQSGGIVYGMLAAKGDGTQTKVYKWKEPKVYNYGLIDLQTSRAYAMASFAGGDVVNSGVINLGNIPEDVEGSSYYTKNYGLYGAGGTDTSNVNLTNNGIINVYAKESTAIYNAFTGAVTISNNGRIFVSNKATGSSAIGGAFSRATNSGVIDYRVGGSESASIESVAKVKEVGFAPAIPVENAVVSVGDSKSEKQFFTNETKGQIIIGDVRGAGKDYGGTYVTAAVRVKNQGTASNKGTITLVEYDVDTPQVNAAMWLDDTTSNEAYINNRGEIVVNSTASIGMRNGSQNGAEATNYGHIMVNGVYDYGMSTIGNGTIFNGRAKNETDDATTAQARTITVTGNGSAGMYFKGAGVGFNYGNIVLKGRNTTAVIFDAVDEDIEHFYNYGEILYTGEKDQTFYWLANGSKRNFVYPQLLVDGYTLAKVTKQSEMLFDGNATVSGENSHLVVAENGVVTNEGNVSVTDGATAIVAGGEDGSTVTLNGGMISVGNEDSAGVGVSAENNGTLVTINSLFRVNNGVGVEVEAGAEVDNLKDIKVSKGVGLDISGKDKDGNASTGKNQGVINVSGEEAIGVRLTDDAVFESTGDNVKIVVSNEGTGVQSSATWENGGSIIVDGAESIGVEVLDQGFTNSGAISLSSTGAYAIYNRGGAVENSGSVVGRAGIGVMQTAGTLTNSGTINLTEGTGVAVAGGTVTNTGTIEVRRGVGVEISNSSAQVVNDTGEIKVTNGSGIKISQGYFTNKNIISVTSGTGMEVTGGYATNEGTINVVDGYGMYVDGADARAVNNGESARIILSGSGYGVYVNKGSFTNAGTIEYNSDNGGQCVGGSASGGKGCVDNAAEDAETPANMPAAAMMYVADNARFVNLGEVNLAGVDVDFNQMRAENGEIVVENGGTFKAESFKGEVVAGKNIVMNGFDDTYVNENSFEGRDDGLSVQSQSYLFTAKAKEDGEALDVELNRKEFEEVVEEEDLAQFLETNYKLEHNEKMYNVLKSAETAEEFKTVEMVESGKNFYANLQRENMAVLRGLHTQEQNRILEDGLDGAFVGADYYRTGKDAQGDLSGYADNVYSPYVGYGKRFDHNWSVGGTLRAAYADAEYDEAHSSRNNKILLASLPVLYQNGDFKFLTTPTVGVGFGEYERQSLSGSYEADTFDVYYGMYNHAEYCVDMKVAELVMEAELNLQGSSMSKAKEDNEGLNLHANHSLSLESGVGVKLRKRIELAKQRSLMLAVGMKYYHEFLDPYDDLTVGMNGSPVTYRLNGYNENKDRLRTSAEAVYKDGDFSVAAEIAHNVEKESNFEGGIGVRYRF